MYQAESAVPSAPPADPGHEVVPATPSHPTAMPRHRKTSAERDADAAEMERFKTEIDLAAYAWANGWRPRNWEGKKEPEALKPGQYRRFGEKDQQLLQVYLDRSGKYLWCDPEDPSIGGSIVDFCRWKDGKGLSSLGEVRKELRKELGRVRAGNREETQPATQPPPVPLPDPATLHTAARARVNTEFEKALVVDDNVYLAGRGLRPETLGDRRFRGTFRVRRYSGEVLFPHDDGFNREAGVCGFERKSPRGTTRFADGGIRALWHSNTFLGDKALVLTESAIDGLSFHQLFPSTEARYMATAGKQKSSQGELIARAMRRLPSDGRLVIATDNDSHHLKDFLEQHAGLRQVLHIGSEANTQVQVFTSVKTGDTVAIRTEPSGKDFACKALTPEALGSLLDWAKDPAYRVRFDQLGGEGIPTVALPEYLAAQAIELGPKIKMPTNPGRVMAQQLRIIAHETRSDLRVESPMPPLGFKDWNEVLQAKEHEFIRQVQTDEKKRDQDRSR
jgi:hypothetical protein